MKVIRIVLRQLLYIVPSIYLWIYQGAISMILYLICVFTLFFVLNIFTLRKTKNVEGFYKFIFSRYKKNG